MSACQFDTGNTGGGVSPVDASPGDLDAPDSRTDGQAGTDGMNTSDAGAVDGPTIDPDAAPACEDWTERHLLFEPCSITNTDSPLELMLAGTYNYDTDTDILNGPDGDVSHTTDILTAGPTQFRVIIASRFTLGTGVILQAQGSLPLVIISWSDISVAGTIDVSSNHMSTGAGANFASCSLTIDGTSDEQGGGGGGGGSFQSVGGAGGKGQVIGGATLGGDGGAGGLVAPPGLIRGGCPGGAGGAGDEDIGFGVGGDGGGAIHLTARGQVTVTGTIHAGGAGGYPGFDDRGAGGGGGSGGLIRLEGNTVAVGMATLAANGGGGGGGGNNNPSVAGTHGLAIVAVASGGPGEDTPAGDGGNGGFLNVLDGQPGIDGERGGGGGGGGVGHIQAFTSNLVGGNNVQSSPQLTN